MPSNRVFQVALLISLVAHGAILLQNPNLNLFPAAKNSKDMQLSYVKMPEEQKIEPKKQGPARKEPFFKLNAKISLDKRVPPPFIDKENIFKTNKEIANRNQAFAKPVFIRPDIIAIKKKITLPPIDADKINDPSYISYYQIVREKIKRAAYQNYTHNETGEVYLTFVISSDGMLRQTRLVEEKSSPIQYLREIALKSVTDASPFPNFPAELNYPQLSFNVIISFEIE